MRRQEGSFRGIKGAPDSGRSTKRWARSLAPWKGRLMTDRWWPTKGPRSWIVPRVRWTNMVWWWRPVLQVRRNPVLWVVRWDFFRIILLCMRWNWVHAIMRGRGGYVVVVHSMGQSMDLQVKVEEDLRLHGNPLLKEETQCGDGVYLEGAAEVLLVDVGGCSPLDRSVEF